MEFLFNETLMGLQDLDVPSGYGIPKIPLITISNTHQISQNLTVDNTVEQQFWFC